MHRFEGQSQDICEDFFDIDESTGLITVSHRRALDREEIVRLVRAGTVVGTGDVVRCFVSCTTTGGQGRIDQVNIEVQDENDCVPHFFNLTQPHYKRVTESTAINSVILTLQPIDQDKGENGTTFFNITGGNEGNYFEVALAEGDTRESTTTRTLFLRRRLDFEVLSNGGVFNLTINITDMGAVPLYMEQRINIQVENIPDEPPTFETTSYPLNVTENHPVGPQSPFARVRASSIYPGVDIAYNYSIFCNTNCEIIERTVGVSSTTGHLFLKAKLDYESLSSRTLSFQVQATDPTSGVFQTAVVNLEVLDENESPPYLSCAAQPFVKWIYPCGIDIPDNMNNSVISIEENAEAVFPRNLIAFRVRDNDAVDEFQFINRQTFSSSIEPSEDSFIIEYSLQPNTAVQFVSLQDSGTLDRERTANYTITFTMENRVEPSLRTETTLIVQVLDVNDNIPTFLRDEYRASLFEGSPEGMQVAHVSARDPDQGENGTLTYSIANFSEAAAREWFQIAEDSGVITIRDSASLDYLALGGSPQVVLTVTATDNGREPLSSSTTVVVSILPASRFLLGSYQEYSVVDFDPPPSSPSRFYLEFSTTEREGLLAYWRGISGGVFSVELRDTVVVARYGNSEMSSDRGVSLDAWYYLLVERTNDQASRKRERERRERERERERGIHLESALRV